MITLVLILGLFYPRVALILGHYGHGILPNPFPFWLDFWLAVLVPRILIIAYIAVNWSSLADSGLWITLHIIALVLSNISDNTD